MFPWDVNRPLTIRSRLNQPEYWHILMHYEEFFNILITHVSNEQDLHKLQQVRLFLLPPLCFHLAIQLPVVAQPNLYLDLAFSSLHQCDWVWSPSVSMSTLVGPLTGSSTNFGLVIGTTVGILVGVILVLLIIVKGSIMGLILARCCKNQCRVRIKRECWFGFIG